MKQEFSLKVASEDYSWHVLFLIRDMAVSYVPRENGLDRTTIRKGLAELKSGITCCDNYSGRGRITMEFKLEIGAWT